MTNNRSRDFARKKLLYPTFFHSSLVRYKLKRILFRFIDWQNLLFISQFIRTLEHSSDLNVMDTSILRYREHCEPVVFD